jgi:hypothetical protein
MCTSYYIVLPEFSFWQEHGQFFLFFLSVAFRAAQGPTGVFDSVEERDNGMLMFCSATYISFLGVTQLYKSG